MSTDEIPLSLPTPVEDRPNYWSLSRAPLAGLVFAVPWLVVYELGIALLGPRATLNGADAMLDRLVSAIGLSNAWAVPLGVAVILLVWHYALGASWHVSWRVLGGMALECVVLAVVLVLFARVQARFFGRFLAFEDVTHIAAFDALPHLAWSFREGFARLVGYCGAGVYEEALFRLMLLPALAGIVRAFGVPWPKALLAAAVVSSVIFSAAHYVGPLGDPIAPATTQFWFSFTFRIAAGLFFALLFVYRGFGVAVGTHALYDIFVGLF